MTTQNKAVAMIRRFGMRGDGSTAERDWYGVWRLLSIILRVVIERHWQVLLSSISPKAG